MNNFQMGLNPRMEGVMNKARRLLVVCLALMLWAVAMPVLAEGEGEKVLFGQDFVLEAGDYLNDDLLAWGGTIVLEADSVVKGDVILVGGHATIGGIVEGNLVVMGGTSHVIETAIIEGDLIALATVDTHPEAQVRGNIVEGVEVGEEFAHLERFVPKPPDAPKAPRGPESAVARSRPSPLKRGLNAMATLVSVLLVGGLVVTLLPDTLGHVRSVMMGYPALSLGVGLLTLVLSAVLLPILILICIGIPLAVVLVVALLICTLFGWVAAGTFLGQKLVPTLKLKGISPLGETLIGTALVTLLAQIPCIGALFAILVASWGIGAVVLTRFGTMPDPWLQTARWRSPTSGVVTPVASLGSEPVASNMPGSATEAPMPHLGRPDTTRLDQSVLSALEEADDEEDGDSDILSRILDDVDEDTHPDDDAPHGE